MTPRYFKDFAFKYGTRVTPHISLKNAMADALLLCEYNCAAYFVWSDAPGAAMLFGAYNFNGDWKSARWAHLQLQIIAANKANPGLWQATAKRLLALPLAEPEEVTPL